MSNDTPETIEIQLGKSEYTTIIDANDEDLASMSWCKFITRGRVYARHVYRVNGKQKTIWLHRLILERCLGRALNDNERPDHKNNNPLNNCRSNLRLSTVLQNSHNQGKRTDNTSGFKGVYWSKQCAKWQAQIMLNGKRKTLGTFDDPKQAHEMYCKAARELHGEFARYE